MKKSTKTPEPATPDQALEDGPSRGGSVSAGTQKIFTALNFGDSFLFFRSASDPIIRITSKSGPFYLWVLTYSDLKKAYQIRSATADRVMTAASSKDEVLAAVDSGQDSQFWKITDAGSNYMYIENLAFSGKVLSVEGASAADDTEVLCLRRTGANSQKFKVVL
ncbi:RICIN domain-containing protein [Pseudomonas sp. MWU13-2105]|uniref:RICIN domain-containing protein n=1 Tax=Pseudomonas sp. MWU13-2105 TaxID=2935074 RepID=UPI00200F6E18|nr:RICIN domain-containing protein [Pseudomonas sp. MWU13-2105]